MNMPVYLQPAATASPSSTQGTMPVKPETAQLMMMMDQSMADASGQDVHMDASDFLFYDDEDLSSSDDDDDDSDDDDSEDDEDGSDSDDSNVSLEHDPETDQKIAEEIRVSMNNMRTGLQRVRSANSLKSMMNGSSNGSKSLRRGRGGGNNEGMPTMILTGGIATPRDPRRRLQASNSMANLAQLKLAAEKAQAAEKKSRMKQSISAGNFTTIRQSAQRQEEIDESIPKPDDHLASLIGGPGERFAYNGEALEGFFLPVKPEYVAAWTNELTRAIRDHDLATVQQLHRQGHRLQACNQFGETSIHLAVRRGSPTIVRYLLQDASVSMRVCCDYGRTPLHDAAWSLSSCTGAFEKMEILLQESPMQLYITDKRGFTPLDYVPRNRWKECNQFLDRQYAKGRLFRIGK